MLPSFTTSSLLETALTHRSALHEMGVTESNERLEFLGDAVLELAVTKYLYETNQDADEGLLTSYRAALVKTTTLAGLAKDLGLGEILKISKGEERSGGRENPGLLADTFEAVVGALYVDQGFEACYTFLSEHLFPLFSTILEQKLYRDHKTALQELVQSQGKRAPVYITVKEEGPDHDKVFTVAVLVEDVKQATGVGKNKQEAQQEAARSALEKITNT